MTHREVLEALSGLLLALFVAMLSSTVVANALPRIVADLEGTEAGYSWVVVATLLALTATTPIWGKLADLYNKKMLVQVALAIYSLGSLLAATAPSMSVLIGARAVQGIGVGGLTALVQVVIASIVTPRDRGRYAGYIGAVFAVATVSGPLIGGVLVDAPGLGWRWTFYVGLPFAVVAFVVLQRTLHLPTVQRPARVDWLGATLVAGGISTLLIWVSLAGTRFGWVSSTTGWMVALGTALLGLAVWTETRVPEPVIPLRLFRDRTTSLATVASVMVGISMFGSTVFLTQYFQISRGLSPTVAGLMTLPMVGGLLVASIATGRLISAYGRWKAYLVGGGVLMVVGLALLGALDAHISLVRVAVAMTVLGVGLGAVNQNLVLAVQNNTRQRDMGAASSLVVFFRTMGGSIGVSALGAALGHQASAGVTSGLQRIGVRPDDRLAGGSIPDMATLPDPVRQVVERAFGDATGHIFWLALPFAVVALVCMLLIREVPLRETIERADELDGRQQTAGATR